MADGSGSSSGNAGGGLDLAPDALALGVAASLTGRRWIWRQGCERTGAALAQRHGLPEIVGRLLAGRGVGHDGAADFLAPTLRALMPDPSVLTDMDAAADRLADAVQRGETVGIFGDYDVDGACSAAVMAGVLRGLGCPVLTHIPDRMTEGYGPNAPALLGLVARGASLVVCVDCGTAAGDVLSVLAGRAEAIVLDHHKADLAPAGIVATVNPNRLGDGSGLGTLCAAGVALLACVALLRTLRRRGTLPNPPDLMALLDIVALATICDVMPLTGLNRALVTQGLKVMERRQRPGLAALLDVAAVRDGCSAFTCGFALGPRINAGGRIGDAGLGLRLLLTEDADEARALAERLDAVNRRRQDVESEVLQAALIQAEAQLDSGRAVVAIAGEGWHPGVVGIIAGRIKERFNRPALVGAVLEAGLVKGSGRSVAGHDLGAAVIAARQAGLLSTGGGHAMAAGFSLPHAGLEALHGFLDDRLTTARLLPRAQDLLVEAGMTVAGASVDTLKQVERLAPYGQGNAEPVFVLPRLRVVQASRVGREGNTLRTIVVDESGQRLKALLFRCGDGAPARLAQTLDARDGTLLHLAGHLRAETWNGNTTVGLTILDAAPAA